MRTRQSNKNREQRHAIINQGDCRPGGSVPSHLDHLRINRVVTNPIVISAAGLMYCAEFSADKIPGIDTTGDTIHTFIGIPAGAILAMAAVGDTNQAVDLAAFILGGT